MNSHRIGMRLKQAFLMVGTGLITINFKINKL